MSNIEIGLAGLAILLVLLAVRMPVGTAMLLVGFAGQWVISDRLVVALGSLATESFETSKIKALIILPLFVLMGNLAGVSRMSRDLYDAAYAWVGHYRGGLASATIIGCAGFSALSGSSLASALTMGRVALPEMQRYKYSSRMATGAIAAGGTLGILIPPSAGFVVYAILTEESIGQWFMAGVLPGLMLAGLFIAAIVAMTTFKPELGPPAKQSMSYADRFAALAQAAPISFIIAVTIGGIYLGVYSATEAAAIGCILAFIFALWRRALSWANLLDALMNTMRSTATTFLILMGAFVFTPFIARSGISDALLALLTDLELSKWTLLALVLVFLVFLGTFLEGFAILVLTIPLLEPVLRDFGFDMVWYGVLMVIVLEMGLISPPVGINVFVVKSIAPDVAMNDIFKGIFPFWLAMGLALILLVAFPQIAMLLPQTMLN
jgi:tripartite ATP-independent transporter DctM subunit